jgi:predicted nucleic acid-binding protein
MKPVILDSSVLVSLIDSSQSAHSECVETLSQLQNPLITCEGVIAESCYLLRSKQTGAYKILENIRLGKIEIPLPLPKCVNKVETYFRKYRNVPSSFVDAQLIVLAEYANTPLILTLDSDFSIYRWGRNKLFEILPDV